MIIACGKCGARFKLDKNLIKPEGSKVRCSNCSQIFNICLPTKLKKEKPLASVGIKNESSWNDAHVIAVSNQKGGVAKTTSCLNLGVSFSLIKKKVLLIDFDVQASLSTCLGCQQGISFYDALNSGSGDISKAIRKTRYPNVWLLPSNQNMFLLNKKYFMTKHFEHLLKEKLNAIKNRFDFILIDTPPAMEFHTLNALTAANTVIIPSNCEFLSAQGVHQTVNFISMIARRTNPALDYHVLITQFDDRDAVSKLIYSKLQNLYGEKTCKTVITLDSKVRESQIMNIPVIYYYKHSSSGLQYVDLARELVEKIGHGQAN
jgi:chromosome partitioning protein